MKTKLITHKQTFNIDGERDISFGANETNSSINWINFRFIFPGIVMPCITFYILFVMVFVFLAVVNGIHKMKISDRDNYIKTLYTSRIIQNYLENMKSSSSENEINDRDNQFDINSEVSQSVKKFEENVQKSEQVQKERVSILSSVAHRDSCQILNPQKNENNT